MQSMLASAVVCLGHLPDKLNPVIRPLMEAAKKEANAQLQVNRENRENHRYRYTVLDPVIRPFMEATEKKANA